MAEDLKTRGGPLRFHWMEVAQGEDPPPLGESLEGWEIVQRRDSHWNGRREHRGLTYHLKWFFHGDDRWPATAEWDAAHRIEALGIPTVVPVGWGRHQQGTFVVLKGSPGFPADQWRARGLSSDDLVALARDLAPHVAKLHDAGLCHRDLNVYHVLVHDGRTRIIDVGRVRPFRRRRWIVKDLAGLLDSARFEQLPRAAARAFFASYLLASSSVKKRRKLLERIERKAKRYRKHNKKHGR